MADKQVKIKITSAIAIGGKIKTPGTIVTVSEDIAKNLLHRGRAELATAAAEGADEGADGGDDKGADGGDDKGGDTADKSKGGKK